MLTLTTGHTVRCARVFIIEGTFTEEEKNDPLQQLLSDRNIGFFYEEALSFPGQAQHELYTLHGLPESL